MNRLIAVPILSVLLLPFGAVAATAGTDRVGTCRPGFDIGANTFAEYLLLERTRAAITDGFATQEAVEASLLAIDVNGDGIVCVKAPGGNADEHSNWQYLYGVADNNKPIR